MHRALIFLFLLFLAAFPAHVAAENLDPITTNRPDFTESTITLLEKEFQLEVGSTMQWFKSGNSAGIPEALLRYGFTDVAELRLQFPDYNFTRDRKERDAGFGNSYVGFSFRLRPLPNGDEVTVMPAVNLSTGAKSYSNDSIDPEVRLCWSRDLSENWSLSMMGFAL